MLRDCGGDIFLVFCLSFFLSHFPYTCAATSDENVLKRFSSARRREGVVGKVAEGCKERENEGVREGEETEEKGSGR